jgi:hypothetical protein
MERQPDQALADHCEYNAWVTNLKGRLRHNRFACKKRFRDRFSQLHRPRMMPISPIRERHQQACVRDPYQVREYPFREERLRGP